MGAVAAEGRVANEAFPGRDRKRPENPWNDFQHAHRGKGLNSQVLSKIYKDRTALNNK
jgi:hypothetical protein